jgi:pyruvate,water dikinase
MVRRDEDLKNFPQGGVLVARHTSPKYVTVMPQAAAIITDHGSPTGHMALLAREFQVPTILAAGNATLVLQSGQEITVDANYNNVYAGIIPELLEPRQPMADELGDSPVFRTLKEVLKKVIPLNLIQSPERDLHPCQLPHHPRSGALRPRIFHAGDVQSHRGRSSRQRRGGGPGFGPPL